jgi:ribosome assembly protein YihI (activator of Der GTPase)
MAQAREHLPRENRQQKKEQHRNFEVVGTRRPNLGEVIKAAAEHNSAADHSCDLEIRETFVIEHPVKFQECDQSEHADQQPKQDFESRERDEERDGPKDDRCDEA